MAEIETRIMTSEQTRAKMTHALGLDKPSALDEVNRSDYATDEEYLDAATRRELEKDSAYMQTRRRLEGELRERREAEERAAQAEEYKALRATVKLDQVDRENVEREARRMAERDLAESRISTDQMGATIARYADELSERAKDDKAGRMQMNALLRRR